MQQLQLEASREELAIFAAAFQRAASLGQLRPGVDVDTVARIVSTSLTGVMYSAMLEPELFELQRDGQQTMDAIFGAFVMPGVFTRVRRLLRCRLTTRFDSAARLESLKAAS